MRSLLKATMLLALLPGCTIHEPVVQIIYTPDKHLTNNEVAFIAPPAGSARPAKLRAPESLQASR